MTKTLHDAFIDQCKEAFGVEDKTTITKEICPDAKDISSKSNRCSSKDFFGYPKVDNSSSKKPYKPGEDHEVIARLASKPLVFDSVPKEFASHSASEVADRLICLQLAESIERFLLSLDPRVNLDMSLRDLIAVLKTPAQK